jgi:anti-sigma factor RsiW
MHSIVETGLEEHLAGRTAAAFEAHLSCCPECRLAVAEMEQLSSLLHTLGTAAAGSADGHAGNPGLVPEPGPGFYLRVAERVEERRTGRAWGLFSLSPVFFRRVAAASLLLLGGLGSFILTRESEAHKTDAVALMAQLDPGSQQPDSANASGRTSAERDRLLAALANYGE